MDYGNAESVSLNGSIGKVRFTETLPVFFIFYLVCDFIGGS